MPPRWWMVFRLVTGKRTYYWALCRNTTPYWPDALGGCTVQGGVWTTPPWPQNGGAGLWLVVASAVVNDRPPGVPDPSNIKSVGSKGWWSQSSEVFTGGAADYGPGVVPIFRTTVRQ